MGISEIFDDAKVIAGLVLGIIDLLTIIGIFWTYNDGSISRTLAGIIALLLFLVNFLVITAVTGALSSLIKGFLSLFNK